MKSAQFSVKNIFTLLLCILVFSNAKSQLPDKVLVGYWENWSSLRIKDADPRYNVIMLAFLEADRNLNQDDNVVGDLEFTPNRMHRDTVKVDIAAAQLKGKKVLVSLGGANGSFKLNDVNDKNTFVSEVKDFIIAYGVDGIDIDIERTVYACMSSGTLDSPETHAQLLIDGIKELLTWYQITYGRKMLLTTAPETLYIQGGLSQWATCGGSFLPFLHQLKDDLDLVMVQLYNSGAMFDLDKVSRSQGNQTFIVSMTEAVIRGFNTSQGFGQYFGISANKVAVALPACGGGGYVSSDDMVAAVKYLMGTGPKVGNYTLKKASGYGDLRGMMTWSINSDASSNCGSYSFADATERIVGPIGVKNVRLNASFSVHPNPAISKVKITGLPSGTNIVRLIDNSGKLILEKTVSIGSTTLNVSELSAGFYTISVGGQSQKLVIN